MKASAQLELRGGDFVLACKGKDFVLLKSLVLCLPNH